jgi:hypothetical protein
MPAPNRHRIYPLSALNEGLRLVRVGCRYCRTSHNYYPDDLIQLFGDVDVDSIETRMRCERCKAGTSMSVEAFHPSGKEAIGLRIRRLVAIKVQRVPVWREE